MKIDFKLNKKNIIKIIILSSVGIIVFIYIIIIFLRFNKINDKISENEIKLNQLVMDLKKEKRNAEKIGNLTNDSINDLFFQKDIDFISYIRKIFLKNNIKVNIYQSNDKNNNLEVILNYNTKVDDFFRILKDIEKGQKFLTIKNITVKKDNYPTLKIYMKIIGYYAQ